MLRSARLVRLGAAPHGDPAFGLEVEITVNVTPSFNDLGPPSTAHDHYRLACAARGGVLDCKEVELVRDADGATIARSLAAPPGALPPLFAKELQHAMDPLVGAHTCRADPAVRDAIEQLARAVGAARSP